MKYLIYNFSGDLDDISHLYPNERLAEICSIIKESNQQIEIWDKGNIDRLISWGKDNIYGIRQFGILCSILTIIIYILKKRQKR